MRLCLDLCVAELCLYSTAQLPAMLSFYTDVRGPNNTLCCYGSFRDPLFTVLFFTLVLNLSLIYEAFLCGCVTRFEANREKPNERESARGRGRGLSCRVSCPTVRSYFSACFTVVGSCLIVGLLGSFRHAWPTLISLVYYKPPP